MDKSKLRKYREEKGMTLKELAQKSGVSPGYLCHLEKGKRANPSTEVMEKISANLGRTIPEVFFSD